MAVKNDWIDMAITMCILAVIVAVVGSAAYLFGLKDGYRQAAPLCVGEDTVRVHRPTQPRGRVP